MHKSKSPAGRCVRGAFLCLLAVFSQSSTADFFLTRNQNPFTLFQGQPPPLPAQAATRNWNLQFSLDVTNTLNAPSTANQSLYIDFESYYLNARISRALAPGWSLSLDIPLIHRGGGMFDNAIDNWHQTFGLPRANRPNVANDQFAIRYIKDGNTVVDIAQTTTDAGDIALNLGYQLQAGQQVQLALWFGAELPTGDSNTLSGNDQTDFSVTLAASMRPAEAWQFDVNLGLVKPGGNLLDDNPAASTVFYSYLATSWRALDWLQLGAQLEMHQSYYRDRSLTLMDHATVLVFGGAIVFNSCSKLHIGVSEDIDVGASPDISLLISWRHQTCNTP